MKDIKTMNLTTLDIEKWLERKMVETAETFPETGGSVVKELSKVAPSIDELEPLPVRASATITPISEHRALGVGPIERINLNDGAWVCDEHSKVVAWGFNKMTYGEYRRTFQQVQLIIAELYLQEKPEERDKQAANELRGERAWSIWAERRLQQ